MNIEDLKINPERDLVLDRVINASPDKFFRAWTEPELIVQWFTPPPWSTASAVTDLRPGGSTTIVMRSPEGQDFANQGVYLEVVKDKKLVFTDAYTGAWAPSEKPFMTVILNFEDLGGKTHYTAVVRHWTEADKEEHEKMGFHEGWGKATDQLEELVAKM